MSVKGVVSSCSITQRFEVAREQSKPSCLAKIVSWVQFNETKGTARRIAVYCLVYLATLLLSLSFIGIPVIHAYNREYLLQKAGKDLEGFQSRVEKEVKNALLPIEAEMRAKADKKDKRITALVSSQEKMATKLEVLSAQLESTRSRLSLQQQELKSSEAQRKAEMQINETRHRLHFADLEKMEKQLQKFELSFKEIAQRETDFKGQQKKVNELLDWSKTFHKYVSEKLQGLKELHEKMEGLSQNVTEKLQGLKEINEKIDGLAQADDKQFDFLADISNEMGSIKTQNQTLSQTLETNLERINCALESLNQRMDEWHVRFSAMKDKETYKPEPEEREEVGKGAIPDASTSISISASLDRQLEELRTEILSLRQLFEQCNQVVTTSQERFDKKCEEIDAKFRKAHARINRRKKEHIVLLDQASSNHASIKTLERSLSGEKEEKKGSGTDDSASKEIEAPASVSEVVPPVETSQPVTHQALMSGHPLDMF